MLFPRFLEFSLQNGLFVRGEAVLLAVSGGPDSICMADLFHRAAAEWDLRLALAYVHHHLRPEADDEERFVRGLAGAWGLPFHALSVHPRTSDSLEAQARQVRLDSLETLARREGYSKTALGHNRGDQAETVLMRLLKGTALRGLAGIKPMRDGFWIHPLLPFAREEITAYLKGRSLEWMEDASNRDPRFLRSRLRHRILPLLRREVNPAADEAIVRTARLLLQDEAFLVDQARAALERLSLRTFPFISLSRPGFCDLHPALQHRVIASLFQDMGFRWETGHVERVLKYAHEAFNGRIQAFGKDLTCVLTCDTIYMCPHGPLRRKVDFHLPGEVDFPEAGFRLTAGWREGVPEDREVSLGSHPPEAVTVRSASSLGKGAAGAMKRLGIPSGLRAFLPILEKEGKILWAPGYSAPTGPDHDPAGMNLIVRWSHDA